MTIGEKIKTLRKKRGITQKQLGDLCGMADSAIRRYENGRANPKTETLQKIADALDVKVSYLMGLNERALDIESEIGELSEELSNEKLSREQITTLLNKIQSLISEQEDLEDYMYEVNSIKELDSSDYGNESVDIELLKYFRELNYEGQDKAIDYTKLLSESPKYRKGRTEE